MSVARERERDMQIPVFGPKRDSPVSIYERDYYASIIIH